MRIAFFDAIGWDYTIESVQSHPLGGTQSALCYLAMELVKFGHEIYLINHTKILHQSYGVTCIPIYLVNESIFIALDLDFFIVINDANKTNFLREILPLKTHLILWTGHDADQPAIQALSDPNLASLYDQIVFVSQWQRLRYIKKFNLVSEQTTVFPNCAAPIFLKTFSSKKSISLKKITPIKLAYTSTPFRGLELLLDIFPNIYAQFKNCQLQVFSSLKVYQIDSTLEQDPYVELYQRCHEIPGVEYIGSVPQPELAEHLKNVAILAYPNTFPETGCIAVMEAMASGCHVITSNLGALPETTAGFATLIPISDDWQIYKQQFTQALVTILKNIQDTNYQDELYQKLNQQIKYIKLNHNWTIRAKEWESWLQSILEDRHHSRLNWQALAKFYRDHQKYTYLISLYESELEKQPHNLELYLEAGIALILNGQESEAQLLWSVALAELSSEDYQTWVSTLVDQLVFTANQQHGLGNIDIAIALRNYVREFDSSNINNLITIANILLTHEYDLDYITQVLGEIKSKLKNCELNELTDETYLELEKLINVLAEVMPLEESTYEILEMISSWKHNSLDIANTIKEIINTSRKYYEKKSFTYKYGDIYLTICRRSYASLYFMAEVYFFSDDLSNALLLINQALAECHTLASQAITNAKKLSYLLKFGGRWQEALITYQDQIKLLTQLVSGKDDNPLTYHEPLHLIVMSFVHYYMSDDLTNRQTLLSQVSSLCQLSIANNSISQGFTPKIHISTKQTQQTKTLKIGYISHCFRTHSVGWLASGLMTQHNHEKFEIYLYIIDVLNNDRDPVCEWYKRICDHYFIGHTDFEELARQIAEDEIDILIDLDSITHDITTAVMCLKPAPIQVCWLGFNAPGLKEIDYFLIDHYVLGNEAQDYYFEKLWRLPNSYISVDGFEVHLATLKRHDLDIPNDVIIFLSSQGGQKRHPDTMSLQLQIIKNVPNSFFLIKGFADQVSIQESFYSIASEIGLSASQLRFLKPDSTSMIHRANLGIADVILDTFPYNGATTTLEALWMGIPLVTRVGQQFAARNSYTFLKNAGVEEGIAWTDEEYVEWGIKFGTDHELRRKVAEKLRRARYSAPLWDAKGFTKEVEAAYQAMWHNYVTGEMILPPGHRIG
ncbi:glycosyltransferase [Synechococcus sp. PCC 6312]|uniref:O-linked N-acetylglucosamine transferase family protein n=1 Tax=Synechococcus sp. (strain ATCC 27167 / PCC 6312) TaxID=195253 RepID=UPI00029EE4AB|nr:glycosyltransferase [Synechococcus sp. PCC 6312]AFY61567.1 putative O-linked N-acetylglucosamine transferase, SPINDLY family [Synechococcus sp. PCC 6312]